MDTRFEWHEDKDRSNQLKHGVSFTEATSAFTDDDSLIMSDPDCSGTEERFIVIGLSAKSRVLVISHCYREADSAIRIISARKATRTERLKYEGHLQ